MEEEVNYASVVIRDRKSPPKVKLEAETIYSDVMPKRPSDSVKAERFHFSILVLLFGILCILLVATIAAVIYVSVVLRQQKSNVSVLKEEKEKLIMERNGAQKMAEDLNRTLSVILSFNTFPVAQFCPGENSRRTLGDCQPCQKDWIPFRKKCYYFRESNDWRTWQDSRAYCQNSAADLVVIDSFQEQEFISNNTKFYYDRFHGYWLGLYKTNNNWVWVDGQNDTLNYWRQEMTWELPAALLLPGLEVTANWATAKDYMRNKFICESDVLIWSP